MVGQGHLQVVEVEICESAAMQDGQIELSKLNFLLSLGGFVFIGEEHEMHLGGKSHSVNEVWQLIHFFDVF